MRQTRGGVWPRPTIRGAYPDWAFIREGESITDWNIRVQKKWNECVCKLMGLDNNRPRSKWTSENTTCE